MLTFIHAADLHLDTPFLGLSQLPAGVFDKVKNSTFQSFTQIVDVAISKKVDFLLLSGDLYDGEKRSLRAQVFLRSEFQRLEKHNIQIFIIHGNHDHLAGAWTTVVWPNNVHFFKEKVEAIPYKRGNEIEAYIHGFSYGRKAINENMVPFYEKINDGKLEIALLHGQLSGSKQEHAPYAPFKLDDLIQKEFDYWALGHIHKGEVLHQDPLIVYPGNIQGRHVNETGPKGCYIVELSKTSQRITFYKTAAIIWEKIEISIEKLLLIDELLTVIGQTKEQLREEGKSYIIQVTLTGLGELHTYFQEEQHVAEFIEILNEGEEWQSPFIWVTALRVETAPYWDREMLKKDTHFISDLLDQIDVFTSFDEALSPLFSHRKAKNILQDFSDHEKRTILQEAENYMITTLLSNEGEG